MEEPSWPEMVEEVFVFVNTAYGQTTHPALRKLKNSSFLMQLNGIVNRCEDFVHLTKRNGFSHSMD